jgi:hypothetical protein
MATKTQVERILEVGAELDPKAVSAEVSFLTGARLKSQKLDGIPGAKTTESPALLPDSVDRWCRHRHAAYRKNLGRALKALEDALFIQGELLVRLHDKHGAPSDEARALAAEEVSPQAEACANCQRIVERTATDKLLGGRCRNYEFLSAVSG